MCAFSPAAKAAHNTASSLSRSVNRQFVEAECLLLGLLSDPTVTQILLPICDLDQVRKATHDFLNTEPPSPQPLAAFNVVSDPSASIFASANILALTANSPSIDVDHLLLATIKDQRIKKLQGNAHGFPTSRTIELAVVEYQKRHLGSQFPNASSSQKPSLARSSRWNMSDYIIPDRESRPYGNVSFERIHSNSLCNDMTEAAEKGEYDPVIGRDEEIGRAIQVLSRRQKNNPILLGEPGVGKTAIVEGIAQKIVSGDVPATLKGRHILVLDLGSMLAGTKWRGDVEEKVKEVLDDVTSADPPMILFIDEIHMLIGAGTTDDSNVDIANLLKPELARGVLRCIGATTLQEYRKYFEKDPALSRRFQKVVVDPPTVACTVNMLHALKPKYEMHHGVFLSDCAIQAAAKLSDRYIHDRFLPDKAIDLIDEAMSALVIRNSTKPDELRSLTDRARSLALDEIQAERRSLHKDDSDSHDNHSHTPVVRSRALGDTFELNGVRESQNAIEKKWKGELDTLGKIQTTRRNIERAKQSARMSERAGNLAHAAELERETVPTLEAELQRLQEHRAPRPTTQSRSLGGNRGGSGGDGQNMTRDTVYKDDVATVVASWTGIPVSKMTGADTASLLSLETALSKRVIGQANAVRAVANAVLRSRAGLSDPTKPTATLAFVGASGVGKTELCKALAAQMFGTERALVRLDMSEYMERASAARLVGAAPGTTGHDAGGQLTEAVWRKPYSVILFDEVEKAHVDVCNVMLQVMDDGRLTDSQGRVVDFTNCVLIFTSNLGAQAMLSKLGDGGNRAGAYEEVMRAMQAHFRPEFLNRIDETVMFEVLGMQELRSILLLLLASVDKRLGEMKMRLAVSAEAVAFILQSGYDPQYGARPLRRAVQRLLETPLAHKLLSQEAVAGDLVNVHAQQNGLTFQVYRGSANM